MLNKRGQFYLIASVILVGILIGFTTLSNSFKDDEIDKSKTYELFENLNLENEDVLNNSKASEITSNDLKNFVEKYNLYLQGNEKIYFITSNSAETHAFSYDYSTKEDVSFSLTEGKVKITIQEKEYNFNVENYIMIFQETNKEQYVIKG